MCLLYAKKWASSLIDNVAEEIVSLGGEHFFLLVLFIKPKLGRAHARGDFIPDKIAYF